MSPGTLGVVAIGRNEGERLARCLTVACRLASPVVYVDSGSSDASVALARGLGATVVELDLAIPFTAARARNAGFDRLRQMVPDLDYVQFIDGDCELAPDWLATARDFLDRHREIAVVCGRRRERHAGASLYNRLCDLEWDTPVGETRACGGDALMRCTAFAAAGGYRPGLIAGEEPELCLRLRSAGGRIWRLDADMTWHDAAMLRFGQWWTRSLRAGHAFAESAALHGAPPEGEGVRECASALLWGLSLPLVMTGLVLLLGPIWLALLALYPLQVLRLAHAGPHPRRDKGWRALFLVLGKFPEMLGVLRYVRRRLSGNIPRLIEYK